MDKQDRKDIAVKVGGLGLGVLIRRAARGITERRLVRQNRDPWERLEQEIRALTPPQKYQEVLGLVQKGHLSVFDLKVGIYTITERVAVQRIAEAVQTTIDNIPRE